MRKSRRLGKEEVYNANVITFLPTSQRVAVFVYVAWLVVEGLNAIAHQIPAYPLRHAYHRTSLAIEVPVMYSVASIILFLLLHSYVGGAIANVALRLIISAHQLVLVLLSVWAISISRNDYMII